ncbi:EAL domain-containing protein [Bacillus sp. V3B]|nr:EAL domain-containing protein [Bacillus sp. V3B]
MDFFPLNITLVELDTKSIFKILDTIKQASTNLDGFNLFINIFPPTLIDPTFQNSLEKLLCLSNIKPSSIVLEISEAERGTNLSILKKISRILKNKDF